MPKYYVKNRRVSYDYDILDRYIAGLVLKGLEVKSIVNHQVSLDSAYITVQKGEAFLVNANIPAWKYAGKQSLANYNPKQSRKLLLKKREIEKLILSQKQAKGILVPVGMFRGKSGKIKLEFILGKARKKYDKRKRAKEREEKREIRNEKLEIIN